MKGKLLTVLLTAGLSATAKAEPIVYYCNSTAYALVTSEEVVNAESHLFRLFIDRENEKIKISGDSMLHEITHRSWGGVVYIYEDGQSFSAHDGFSLVKFKEGHLLVTKIALPVSMEMFVKTFSADCEKY